MHHRVLRRQAPSDPPGAPSAQADGNGKRRGFGVALSAHVSGLLASGAIVRVLEDGSVLLLHTPKIDTSGALMMGVK